MFPETAKRAFKRSRCASQTRLFTNRSSSACLISRLSLTAVPPYKATYAAFQSPAAAKTTQCLVRLCSPRDACWPGCHTVRYFSPTVTPDLTVQTPLHRAISTSLVWRRMRRPAATTNQAWPTAANELITDFGKRLPLHRQGHRESGGLAPTARSNRAKPCGHSARAPVRASWTTMNERTCYRPVKNIIGIVTRL